MSVSEKSDLLIVPVKPANNAARAVAESVEGSSWANGNARLQNRVRTQSREAQSHAQDRIRETVNRNRKDRLTALLHHITVDVLRAAFFALSKDAAPGTDGVTWDAYAEGSMTSSPIFIVACNWERIERCPLAEGTYPRQTANNGRSALLPWKTRSFRQR
jgi:hypothetical protein